MENLKTVILTSDKNRDFKAILNLKNKEGIIRFFSSNLTNSNLALGIKQETNILKIPLKLNGSNCAFSLPDNFDYKKNVMCAVVDVSNAFCPEIILSGSVNKPSENVKIETAFVQTKPEDTSLLYEQESDAQIDSLIDKNLEEDNKSIYYDSCATCKYRKAFYEEGCCCSRVSSAKIKEMESSHGDTSSVLIEKDYQVLDDNNVNKTINKQDFNFQNAQETEKVLDSFYFQVKPQIDALFERYKSDEVLDGIIANSKWVRVAYDGGEEFYVLGLIFNEFDKEQVDFICYGVPSSTPDNPPEDIKDYAQWLPVDMSQEKGEGYFIVYQNAVNGETVSVNFV